MSDPEARLAAALHEVWAHHWEGSGASSSSTGDFGQTAITAQTWKVYDPMLPNGLAAAVLAADPTLAADLALAAAVRRLEATGLDWKVVHDEQYAPRWSVTVYSESTMALDSVATGDDTLTAAIEEALNDD